MNLSDADMLELLDWRPDSPAWRSEWMELYDRGPASGWRVPSAEWIDWARRILQQPLTNTYGLDAVTRILIVAEALHPQGLDQRRLRDAVLALANLHGKHYGPAGWVVDNAEGTGVIRAEKIDLWHPGMVPGSGWREYCRLTLHGRQLAKADQMPDAFPAPPPEPTRNPFDPPEANWFGRGRAATAKPPTTEVKTSPADSSACAIPRNFSWAAPFVDQQVRKFFRRYWDDYTQAVQAVVNEQMKMGQFGLDFGPGRISDWINEVMHVPADHSNPCSKQNINTSATYAALVKAFKRNPREHAVVQRLQHGRSEEAQAILDEFLCEPGSSP